MRSRIMPEIETVNLREDREPRTHLLASKRSERDTIRGVQIQAGTVYIINIPPFHKKGLNIYLIT